MQVGTLVKGIYTSELWVVTKVKDNGYVVINNRWTVPIDHLEVLSG